MLTPYKGRVYDPCCGSGGMFVQSAKFLEAHAHGNGNGGKAKSQIAVYGQESNYTTWRLCKMNLAIRGIDGHIAHGDSFHDDQYPDLKADYVLANPPFNSSDWRGKLLKDDRRWQYGQPPANNANYAWIQHFIYHLAPTGMAGFVLANGSMSSTTSGEGEIRKAIIEANLVNCMVALPGQLFYSTQIPVCLWFLTRDKKNGKFRDRRGSTLFIDACQMGTLVDRVHRELTVEDIAKIAGIYHAWRGDRVGADLRVRPPSGAKGEGAHTGAPQPSAPLPDYADVAGFCKAAKLEEMREHGYVLTPGRYVGAADVEGDEEPFDRKMKRLATELNSQMAEAKQLDMAIRTNLKGLGYGE
jgi:type I restriction enzyme M protein